MIKRLTHSILPLARHELTLGVRGGAGGVCLGLCAVAGLIAGSEAGMTPSLAGYRVVRLAALLIGFLCLPLVAAAARRDAATRAADAVGSRPHQAHELLLARWLGTFGTTLAMLLVLAVFTFGAQALLSHRPPVDAGPRFAVMAFIHALFVGALPLLFISAAAYCFVEILQNVLASAAIALYWLLVMLGRDYVARIFDFSLAQNASVYILLSAGAVLAAMSVARLRQGLSNARKLNIPAAALLCLVGGVLLAWHLVATRHDPPLHADPVTQAEASQTIRSDRLPGFWLPDQHGHMVRLRDFAGKPVVVGFWSPAVPGSVDLLASFERLQQTWSARGVLVVAVCLANDRSLGRRFGREQGCTFPVVTDDGTHWAEDLKAASPLGEAYDLGELPAIFVADTERNLVFRASGAGASLAEAADAALRRILPAP